MGGTGEQTLQMLLLGSRGRGIGELVERLRRLPAGDGDQVLSVAVRLTHLGTEAPLASAARSAIFFIAETSSCRFPEAGR